MFQLHRANYLALALPLPPLSGSVALLVKHPRTHTHPFIGVVQITDKRTHGRARSSTRDRPFQSIEYVISCAHVRPSRVQPCALSGTPWKAPWSACASVCPSVQPSACPSVRPTVRPSVRHSFRPLGRCTRDGFSTHGCTPANRCHCLRPHSF